MANAMQNPQGASMHNKVPTADQRFPDRIFCRDAIDFLTHRIDSRVRLDDQACEAVICLVEDFIRQTIEFGVEAASQTPGLSEDFKAVEIQYAQIKRYIEQIWDIYLSPS